MRVLAVCAILAVVGAWSAPAAEAPWETQLNEMGYLIFHLSNINVINGLNLTREQAQSLREMAQQVQSAAPAPPALTVALNSPLDLPRSTYWETRGVLLQGEIVPDELRQRVAEARAEESAVIRASLTSASSQPGAGTCVSCHVQPDWNRIHGSTEPSAAFQQPETKAKAAMAHMFALVGWRGWRQITKDAPRIDAILNDWQKMTLGKFSCCLVPPKDLAEPARIGQAPVSQETVELLDKVRSVSDRQWPWVRAWAVSMLVQGERLFRPDLAGKEEEAFKQEVAQALDEARKMPPMEFEVEKENLAKKMRLPQNDPKGDTQRQFKTAFFLLIPGSVAAYDALLERMNSHTG